jgi:myo-inositol-1-phosphate synthase
VKIWLIGARGTVASTAAVGTLAVQRGLVPLEGVITESEPFHELPLPRIEDIEFGGCDLIAGTMWDAVSEAAVSVEIFRASVLEALAPELRKVPMTRGIMRGGGEAVRALAPGQEHATETARAALARITKDILEFTGGGDAAVVNCSSTEPLPDDELMTWDLAAWERALDANDPRFPASALYAYAALRAGIPYVNFTPSSGASFPAIIELAHEVGLPLAGRDGKTGETLVKTALAPMFAIRALTVEGWYAANILGNKDGQVLADPKNKETKIASKAGVLEQCLGYAPDGDVRIDYFRPLMDHKVAWDFIQFRGWGGHRMRMQFTWEGTDSALAAPLIVDLARLVNLAQQRGESGPIAALAVFFKSPEGTHEMNLHRQYEALLHWLREESSEVAALLHTGAEA